MPTPAADWVSFDADTTEGLDLLGLRAPVQAIGNELFNGVTTVTPKLRYFSVLAWIIWRYARARLPDAWTPFVEFAAAQEAAVVMANLLQDRTIVNLVGANAARKRLDSGRKTLPLSKLVQNIAFNIYISSSRDLHLTHVTDSGFNGITKDRGLPLAEAFDKVVSISSYADRLRRQPTLERVPREELETFPRSISLDRIPAEEKAVLIEALMPVRPEKDEWHRLENYALLLWLSQTKGSAAEEADVFAAALEPPEDVPASLRPLLNRWLTYIVRDSLAVTHEAVFEAVMHEVDVKSAARGGPALAADVVGTLLAATSEHDEALRQFGLLQQGETVASLSFNQLRERIQHKCRRRESISDGLRRWHGGLSEVELYDVALEAGVGSAALLPVAWCLAAHRTEPAIQQPGTLGHELLQTGEFYKIGLRDVVLPKIESFARENPPLLAVMGELITRTVQQHLRTAWTRFAAREAKDVSVLVADVQTWSRNAEKGFEAGRTDSRLWTAIGWLDQLGLIDDDGLTAAGRRALERCLKTVDGRHHA